ncbi:MAG TPA: FAD-dependent oxidoreductase, partial [bacterium]|nr:FAD-dependent oxidoreductase [bacterium]
MGDETKNIAVIGGGAAGLTAAYLLQQNYTVTLYERNPYAGGHANTVVIPNGPDKGKPVDTGFTLLNDQAYPTFSRLLKRLEVRVRPSELSFGYWNEKSGLQYAATGLNGLFAKRSNLWNSSFWKILNEWSKFKRRAARDRGNGALANLTLGEYLEQEGYSKEFTKDCLLPLGSAVWCTSVKEIELFPADFFIRVLRNFGLLDQPQRVQWQMVEGGSHSYVKAILKTFKTQVHLGEIVEEVRRKKDQVLIRTRSGLEHTYDKVVLACHADEALGFLAEP